MRWNRMMVVGGVVALLIGVVPTTPGTAQELGGLRASPAARRALEGMRQAEAEQAILNSLGPPTGAPVSFANGAAAGVYAVRRTVTQATCREIRTGRVSVGIWLLGWSHARGWILQVLGDTSYRSLTGAAQGDVLTLTGSRARISGQMTLTLRPVSGGLQGTETVTTSIGARPCSIIREVVATDLSR